MNSLARGLGVSSLALVGALALAGCSSSSDSSSSGTSGAASSGGASSGGTTSGGTNSGGSCNAGKDSPCSVAPTLCCSDYPRFSVSSVQNTCSAAAGTFSASPCSTANREGTCTLYTGTVAEKNIRYYAGFDAANSGNTQSACAALHGVWAPN